MPKISELPTAGSVASTDYVPVVVGGVTKKAAISTVTAGLGVSVPAAGLVGSNGTALTSVTTSAGVAALVSDETGSGAMVFANTPTLVTPIIGAATGTSLVATGVLEGSHLQFPLGVDPRAAAGKIRLSPYSNDIIAIREHDNLADRVALSTWHSGSNYHIVVLGAGQTALTPFDQVDLWVKNTGVIRLVVDGGTKLRAVANGLQIGNGSADLGGGNGVIGIDNATTAPSTNPTAGIVLYVDSADNTLKYRKADGSTVTLSGTSFSDAAFEITDDGDATKVAKFQCSGITTGTTRTYTLPNVSDTLVTLAATQTLTNKTIDLGSNTLTFTSAQLRAACSDETGAGGSLVFATSPTISGVTLSSSVTITATNTQATGNARCSVYSDVANVQTTDATATTIFSWTPADEATTMVTVELAVCTSTGSAGATYVRRCRIKRDGGIVTVGTVSDVVTDEDGFNGDVTIDNSGTTARVRVTGVAATTADWGCVVTRMVVTHA